MSIHTFTITLSDHQSDNAGLAEATRRLMRERNKTEPS